MNYIDKPPQKRRGRPRKNLRGIDWNPGFVRPKENQNEAHNGVRTPCILNRLISCRTYNGVLMKLPETTPMMGYGPHCLLRIRRFTSPTLPTDWQNNNSLYLILHSSPSHLANMREKVPPNANISRPTQLSPISKISMEYQIHHDGEKASQTPSQTESIYTRSDSPQTTTLPDERSSSRTQDDLFTMPQTDDSLCTMEVEDVTIFKPTPNIIMNDSIEGPAAERYSCQVNSLEFGLSGHPKVIHSHRIAQFNANESGYEVMPIQTSDNESEISEISDMSRISSECNEQLHRNFMFSDKCKRSNESGNHIKLIAIALEFLARIRNIKEELHDRPLESCSVVIG